MPGKLIDDGERGAVRALAALADANPFLSQRLDLERSALGSAFERTTAVWHAQENLDAVDPNLTKLGRMVEELAPLLRDRLAAGAEAHEDDLLQYEALARHFLFQRYDSVWWDLIESGSNGRAIPEFRAFAHDTAHFFAHDATRYPFSTDAADLFAWGFQVRRAFHHTFRQIFGGSLPAAQLRAAVWQSIFTHDMRRYRRTLVNRMHEVTTLITGESGTGKELVARAIALSSYIPIDPERMRFAVDFQRTFFPVNLAALSPTLIESELFGHRRGAFTGALENRSGWLENCGQGGAVFLDEIGELDGGIQVKLLRVLQSRVFQRIGETEDRTFAGKIIAATHRDLAAEMRAGAFRPDLYYRLCSDTISTPALRDQLADNPADLRNMIELLAARLVADDEVEALSRESEQWILTRLGIDYAWPGNVRELEQCVRNVLIRGEYHPTHAATATGDVMEILRLGTASAEELLRQYCRHVYALTGSYQETARRIGLDRRTVRAKVNAE